jgi:hypothetical protein
MTWATGAGPGFATGRSRPVLAECTNKAFLMTTTPLYSAEERRKRIFAIVGA